MTIKPGRKALFTAIYLAFLLLLTYGGLKFLDWRLGKQYAQLDIPDMDMPGRTVRTLDLYPYDGFHVQAWTHHKGPMYWEYTSARIGAEVKTGDKGYFIDFPLEQPPAKATNEFRIVLFGGSGAQGWGATSQDKMFYRLLERYLQGRFPALRIRVINMAMGSSTAYQNFISLNRWGHKLQPDMMLGYVGRNDYVVPFHEAGTDWYCYSSDIQAMAMATRGFDSPPGLRWLVKLMPNLMHKSTVGVGLRVAFGMDYYRKVSKDNYARSTGITTDVENTMDKVAIPQLVLALQSIKRDFDGIPMFIAWQAISHELAMPDRPPGTNFYNRMFGKVVEGTIGTINEDWYYLNVHQIGMAHTPANFGLPNVFSTHLTDRTHDLVARILADSIGDVMVARSRAMTNQP